MRPFTWLIRSPFDKTSFTFSFSQVRNFGQTNAANAPAPARDANTTDEAGPIRAIPERIGSSLRRSAVGSANQEAGGSDEVMEPRSILQSGNPTSS